MPASAFDQWIDNLGPQSRAGRVAVGIGGGVAKHRGAKLWLVAPDFGNAVPAFDQNVVNVVAGRCEQVAGRSSFCGINPGLSTPWGSSIFFWA